MRNRYFIIILTIRLKYSFKYSYRHSKEEMSWVPAILLIACYLLVISEAPSYVRGDELLNRFLISSAAQFRIAFAGCTLPYGTTRFVGLGAGGYLRHKFLLPDRINGSNQFPLTLFIEETPLFRNICITISENNDAHTQYDNLPPGPSGKREEKLCKEGETCAEEPPNFEVRECKFSINLLQTDLCAVQNCFFLGNANLSKQQCFIISEFDTRFNSEFFVVSIYFPKKKTNAMKQLSEFNVELRSALIRQSKFERYIFLMAIAGGVLLFLANCRHKRNHKPMMLKVANVSISLCFIGITYFYGITYFAI